MNLSILIAFVLHNPHLNSQSAEAMIPSEFEGVWAISAVTDDGVAQPDAQDSVTGALADVEIVICKNRVVLVRHDGSSMVGKVKVVGTEPELKLELVTGIYHDKEGHKSYALLKRSGDELIFAWVSPEMRVIDSQKGGGQIVMTATSQN